MPGQFGKAGNIKLRIIIFITETHLRPRGTQLLAESLLPHSLSHDCYIKQKHKSDYYQVATSVVL
jgi:hypothetical protein